MPIRRRVEAGVNEVTRRQLGTLCDSEPPRIVSNRSVRTFVRSVRHGEADRE